MGEQFARELSLDERSKYAMNLALEDIFTNMVKYGGGGDAVTVELDVRDGSLVIEFEHEGAVPFDPTHFVPAGVDQPLSERRPGGMGLHLVRRMMDDVTYAHEEGCARITLTRHLGGA